MMHSTSFPPLASDHGELLVRQAAARNEQAFEALYDSYVPLVYGVARRILGCDNDGVEAVVQTTFMKFWRFAPSYKRGNVAGMLAVSREMRRSMSYENEKLLVAVPATSKICSPTILASRISGKWMAHPSELHWRYCRIINARFLNLASSKT